MKKFLLLFTCLFIFILEDIYGQAGEWVWIHGDSTTYSTGNYGIQGVPSPTNEPPALQDMCEWTDLNGNFWLYGGQGFSALCLSALWKYDPTINEWTWMSGDSTWDDTGSYGLKGIPSPNNRPPALVDGIASWVDNTGNLWMFGGYRVCGVSSGMTNTLWEYNINNNEWTWIKGSNGRNQNGIYGTQGIPDTANNPGARSGCGSAWTDNTGQLWFIGGKDLNNVTYNDLWRYNIPSNTWTWMKGSNIPSQNGNYGIIGVEDSLNTPGARKAYCHWKDNNGKLWLFAGGDYLGTNNFNDLWRYNIVTNNWTWMNGSDTVNSPGLYGSKCNLSYTNIPCKRSFNSAVWTDSNGNFWLFGGERESIYPNTTVKNDLWKYCVAINQWAWINGDSISNPSGNWGIFGITSPTNQPKGKESAIGWSDHNGHFYLFGGSNPQGIYNDLWKYTIDTTCAPCNALEILPTANFILSNSTICMGECVNFTNISQQSTSYQWFFPGGTPSSDTSANPQNICYNNSGTFDVTLIARNSNGSDTLTLPNYLTVYPQIPFSALTQSGDTLFSIPGYPSYEWFDGSALITGASNYYYVATHSGNYSVVVTDSNGCFATAQLLNVIASVNNIENEINFNAQYSSGTIYLKLNSADASLKNIEITDGIGNFIYQKKFFIDKGKNEIEITGLNLSSGIYFIKISNSGFVITRKIFIP